MLSLQLGCYDDHLCHGAGSSSSNPIPCSNYWRIQWSPRYNIRPTNWKWRTCNSGILFHFFFSFSLVSLDYVCLWLAMKLQVVHTLTDGTVPSQELISTIKRLYDTKLKVVIDCLLVYFYLLRVVLFLNSPSPQNQLPNIQSSVKYISPYSIVNLC